jgi:hypothetical protein
VIDPGAQKSHHVCSRRWREIFERLVSACVEKETAIMSARMSKPRAKEIDDEVFAPRKQTPSYQYSQPRLPSAMASHLFARPRGGLSPTNFTSTIPTAMTDV